MTSAIDFSALALKYSITRQRLIIFNYDMVFQWLSSSNEQGSHSKYLKDVVSLIASDRRNDVMLISERDKESLVSWRHIPVILVAESGGYCWNRGSHWHSPFSFSTEWISSTLSSLNALCFQYEGTFVEPRTFSLSWHYEAIANRISDSEKQQILAAIRSLPDHEYFNIYLDDCKIELRTKGIDRASFVTWWKRSRQYDFVMILGCGSGDEGLFKMFGESGFPIRIGPSAYSAARFHLNGQKDVLPFMQKLVEANCHFEKTATKMGIQNG